jgi:hypothetical protein
VLEALAAWNATGCVTFREVDSGANEDVELSWRTGEHPPCVPFGTDTSVAHTGPATPGTFVHFDAERAWGTGDLSLEQVALHELGHVLGLDHSEDERAAMYAVPSLARAKLSRTDLDGLRSLYGGGTPAPSDLAVFEPSSGREAARLHEVAPREQCGWSVFDADGDGSDEVLVWRTDEAGFGALTLFHFTASGELARTSGPMYGVVPPGAVVEPRVDAAGRRVLVAALANGARSVHVFDERGLIASAERSDSEPAPSASVPIERVANFSGAKFVVR